jgi:hypothetical protein
VSPAQSTWPEPPQRDAPCGGSAPVARLHMTAYMHSIQTPLPLPRACHHVYIPSSSDSVVAPGAPAGDGVLEKVLDAVLRVDHRDAPARLPPTVQGRELLVPLEPEVADGTRHLLRVREGQRFPEDRALRPHENIRVYAQRPSLICARWWGAPMPVKAPGTRTRPSDRPVMGMGKAPMTQSGGST